MADSITQIAQIVATSAAGSNNASSAGKGNTGQASIEISLAKIPQSAKNDQKLLGEITAKLGGDKYILTLKSGENIEVKINPPVPVGTKLVAELDPQGKPISAQFIPPKNPQNSGQGGQQNAQNTPTSQQSGSQSQLNNDIPSQRPLSQNTPQTNPTAQTTKQLQAQVVNQQGYIQTQALNKNSFILLTTGTKIPLPENVQLLPQPAHLPVVKSPDGSNIIQASKSITFTVQEAVMPIHTSAKEIPFKIAITMVDGKPLEKPVFTQAVLPENSKPLQTVQLNLSPQANTAQVTQATAFTPTANLPNQNIPLTFTRLSEAVNTQVLQQATIAPLKTPLPEGATLFAKVITIPTAEQTQAQAGRTNPTFTQVIQLPSGETTTLNTPRLLPLGTAVELEVPANQSSTNAQTALILKALPQAATPQIQNAFELPQTFTARVTAQTTKNTYEISLPTGQTSTLKAEQPLPIGTELKLQTVNNNNFDIIAVKIADPLLNKGEAISKYNSQWQALQEALSTLRQNTGTLQTERSIPEIHRNSLVTLPLFAQAVIDGASEKWLGQETVNLLKAFGVDLSPDLNQLNQLMSKADNTPDSWRALFFPYQNENETLKQGGFYWKNEDDSTTEKRHIRFIVESELNTLGAFQIDGLVSGKNLNLNIRTQKRWDDKTITGLKSVVSQTLETLEYTGSLNILTNKSFEKVHLEGILKKTHQISISI